MKLEQGDIMTMFGRSGVICFGSAIPISSPEDMLTTRLAKHVASFFPFNEVMFFQSSLSDLSYGYGFKPVLFSGESGTQLFAAFQTRTRATTNANRFIFMKSIVKMFDWIINTGTVAFPTGFRVDFELPSGPGELARSEMIGLLKFLPDCVTVWEYQEEIQKKLIDVI